MYSIKNSSFRVLLFNSYNIIFGTFFNTDTIKYIYYMTKDVLKNYTLKTDNLLNYFTTLDIKEHQPSAYLL